MTLNFLVATDGSEEADNALAYATDISDTIGGSITVVHAVNPAPYEEREKVNPSRASRMPTADSSSKTSRMLRIGGWTS